MNIQILMAGRDVGGKALQESEQRYRRLLASATDYIYTVQVENGLSAATAHGAGCVALTGYTPAEYSEDSQLWFRIVHPDDREPVLSHASAILRGITPPPLEHRIIHKDGGIRWLRNTSVPHKDDQGQVLAYDGLISDITERKLAEHRLKRASSELSRTQDTLRETLRDLEASHQELKISELELIQAGKLETLGTLTATLAHEVKNPLQTVLQGLDYLANHTKAIEGDGAVVLDSMREAVTRANQIIGEVLDFSGAAAEFGMKEENFNTLMERALLLMKYELTASRIGIVRDYAVDLPLVPAVRGQIEQLFINLFINAVQAMSVGGTLTVATRLARWHEALLTLPRVARFQKGEQVVIAEVLDTGSGIPVENLKKLFDPFFTTKAAVGGTGLGLSVIKKIMDLHGGLVQIENAPQRGVKVTLVFKAATQDRPSAG